MKTHYKSPLLGPDGFQSIHLGPQSPGLTAIWPGWSVRSHTLHGGVQEGVQVVEIHNGKLSFSVLPTRGMGIWKGECKGTALGWKSPVKAPVHPAFVNLHERQGLGWLDGFNEWVVRCGLNSLGPPGVDNGTTLTLHGKIANIPAHTVLLEITDEAIILRGEVDEVSMFGPALRLSTEIRTEFGSGAFTIIDTVTNLGDLPADHQLMYHINYGAPLLEKGARLVAPYKCVSPRDARAAESIGSFDSYDAPQVGFAEQVYFYELAGKRGNRETLAMLQNAAGDHASLMRFSLSDLPCFVQWKNTGGIADGYVTGLEPSTCFPNSRQFERQHGRVIRMAGGESRATRLTIEALTTKSAVSAARAEIRQLQKSAKAKVAPQPISRLAEG